MREPPGVSPQVVISHPKPGTTCHAGQVGNITTPEQGYLDHKQQRPPRTLEWKYALNLMAGLRGGAVSYERGPPVGGTLKVWAMPQPRRGFGTHTECLTSDHDPYTVSHTWARHHEGVAHPLLGHFPPALFRHTARNSKLQNQHPKPQTLNTGPYTLKSEIWMRSTI